MGKLIWRGFSKSGDLISSQAAFITGANLRRNTPKTSSKEKKKSKKPIKEGR